MLLCVLDLITPNKAKRVVLHGFNFLFSFILFAATIYFAYFGTVPTYAVLGGLNQVPQVRASVSALLQPQQFLFFLDILLMLLWGFISRVRRIFTGRRLGYRSEGSPSQGQIQLHGHTPGNGRFKIGIAVILVISLAGSILYIRAGKNIDNELVRAESIGFLNYQADAMIRNRQEERLIADGNLQETVSKIAELQTTYPFRDNSSPATLQYFGAARGKNLIVIQLESFQNFPIHLELQGQEVTPVLNRLADEGLYFPYMYQQIGPGNTSDAEFMSNTSIYPTADTAMSQGFGDRELPSLPRLLQSHGYVANTFHINKVTFWDRHKMYPALNFDKYYDKPFYNNDHFNDFGASDEEMYRVGLEKLTEIRNQGKPFYAQFVTTSSHSPFIVPKEKQRMTLPVNLQGTKLGNYLQAVNYTDYAVGTLIERLKAAGMWEDTLLVLYGDHFGVQPDDISAEEIQSKLGIKYHDRISRFNVPFIVHVPEGNMGKVISRTGGQVDILPTITNLLGVSLEEEGFTALGHDLLNIDRNVIGMRYYLPTGSFFNDEVMFVPGKGFEDGQAISLLTFETVADTSKYQDDYKYITELMKLSDEYVELLPKRGH